jgi:hypothetical protein
LSPGVLERWGRSHPWAAAYIVTFCLIAIVTVIAALADWSNGAVVVVALCAIAIGGFLLDELKNGTSRRSPDEQGQGSQRAQTE